MSLRDLLPKSLPFSKAEAQKEYYFALDIGFSDVVASVWGVSAKSLDLVNIAAIPFGDLDQLSDASNQALDEALRDFQPEPTKILFGVPDNWLQDDNLKDEYLILLKKLVKELDVSPMAFVSTTHALTHLLQKQTGIPPTVILVEVVDPLSVTVVKAGKILGTKLIKREGSLSEDIERALAHFSNIEVLPSKIAIFGQDNLEKYKDELLSYNWMNNLPFLHLPKVEILEEQVGIKAVSLAGASEINPDVTYTRMEVKKEVKVVSGFVEGDIEKQNVTVPKESKTLLGEEVAEEVFERGSNIAENAERALSLVRSKLAVPEQFLIKKGIKIPKLSYLIPVILLFLLVAAFLFLSRAKVVIYIDPKILERDAQVIADPSITSVDQTNKKIPGKIVEADVAGSGSGNATGKKQIGDPSRGTVTIRNKSASTRSFSQGTVFIGPNNLKFTLDSSTPLVAPPSADTGAWGTATGVNLTASQIGPDSNLPAGTILTIQNQAASDFDAKVEGGLSGGTSKDVTVVTVDDQKKLLASVASDLRQKAQEQIQSKLSGDQKVLTEGLDEKITQTNFSKNVGDQATSFTLNLSAHYKGTTYSDNDLKQMVAQLVQTNVPDGYTLDLQDTETSADVSKLGPNGQLIFLARFKAKLLPKLDLESIKRSIKGKTPADATDILKHIENVIDVKIDLTPRLPDKIARLPLFANNINLEVAAK